MSCQIQNPGKSPTFWLRGCYPISFQTKTSIMFNLFKKDPVQKLRKQYEKALVEARDLQRKGDIKAFAQKSAEAEALMQEIERIQKA